MRSAATEDAVVGTACVRWYRNGAFWRTFLGRYLPGIGIANLLWEIAQLPLFTLWTEASNAYIAYAVLHCTVGDVVIAASALVLAMCLAAPPEFPERGVMRVVIVATLLGVAYTVFSEWLNTAVRNSWAYASAMPVVPILNTGLAPLAQWLVLPPALVAIAFHPRYPVSCAASG